MVNLYNYITEKLKINKNIKVKDNSKLIDFLKKEVFNDFDDLQWKKVEKIINSWSFEYDIISPGGIEVVTNANRLQEWWSTNLTGLKEPERETLLEEEYCNIVIGKDRSLYVVIYNTSNTNGRTYLLYLPHAKNPDIHSRKA